MRAGLLRWALAALAMGTVPAGADCRHALALGLDVSGSVDAEEYGLQFRGLAAALLSDDVRAALFAIPEAPVSLAVFEWSGPDNQHLIVPWTEITDEATLAGIAGRLAAMRRIPGRQSVTTAVGAAMIYGDALLSERPDCWRHTLDLSGDGWSNTGPRPMDVVVGTWGRDVTVNALVISDAGSSRSVGGGMDLASLIAFFRNYAIRGPDAFVEAAAGFPDFEAAMTRKLVRELSTLAVGGLPGPGRPPG